MADVWEKEVTKVKYPAARITNESGYEEYWMKAKGNWKQAAAENFFKQDGVFLLIEVPNEAKAKRLLRYKGSYEHDVQWLASRKF